ncbi:hypothetical protein [uncultured Amnibacterium sp.]|uniref:hypothetical protein n=1 Tax=uncultured Amnibacterium sp. TaxID=1631851 RepID=UPI0035CA415B
MTDATREREQRADALKERIYITFTALAVVLALRSELAEHASVGGAASTLALTVVATLLAVLVADVVSHITAHEALPTRAELSAMLRVVVGSLAVLVLPSAFLGLAALHVWTLDGALRGAEIALIVALVAIGWIAVRRLRLPWFQRLVVLLAEAALGLAVIALELLAH